MASASTTFRLCDQRPSSLKGTLAEALTVPPLLATMLRSMIEAWPEEVYAQPAVATRFLGRRTTFVCEPQLIRSLLVDQSDALERETFMLRALAPALGRGILTADGAFWRGQRRTAAPMFRPDRIRGFVPAIAAAAEAGRARWQAAAKADAPAADILPELMRTAFEIIVATMISGDSEMQVGPFGRAIDDYLSQTQWKIALAHLGAPEWMPHPGARRGAAAARFLRRETARTVARRRARGEPGRDLLGLLLEARDPETGLGLPEDALIDNLLTFVAAGHETTALALAWTLRLVADRPEVEARMLAEIAALPAPLAENPDGVERLTYTRQVLMESMRLYPPAPLIVRRATAEVRLGEARIPAGESIHVPVYALHRNRALWDRPDAFDPDRFAPAIHAGRDRYAYLPFGAGPRVCIGMGLALTECLVVLATLLPALRFVPERAEMPEAQFRVTLRPRGGIPMRVVARHAG
ncbi:cytochrome P450 [Methylobacterium sp. Leaf456]|uniref:cytochrome P450 n=1 Tax=Methylobacterium sp. Leaf456 TaxID=1736382 RepID=UPI0006FE040D|nr:cytochrome P450 [Methylobacterium sp. Leaf456]KQT46763.1 cytochrome P450 [Methylobacterium sp. Leaf456]